MSERKVVPLKDLKAPARKRRHSDGERVQAPDKFDKSDVRKDPRRVDRMDG